MQEGILFTLFKEGIAYEKSKTCEWCFGSEVVWLVSAALGTLEKKCIHTQIQGDGITSQKAWLKHRYL